ncbi:hypothetical protein WJX81_000043 [Elliptochloris bilobata]|uniref:Cytochrome P450 n=1 Tax=Elliptochloris bilobata TaxID=381761 RepID=A0AAW1SBE0_9CHLO
MDTGRTQQPTDSASVMAKQGMEFAKPLHARLGPLFTTWVLGEKTVVVGSLELLRKCLSKEHELVEGDWPKATSTLLGPHSVTATTGDAHLRMRKILNPAFTVKAVAEFVPGMVGIAQRCCADWQKQGRVSGYDCSKEYTFLVALKIILGFKDADISASMLARCRSLFWVWLNGLFSFPIDLPGFTFYKAMKANKELRAILAENLQRLTEESKQPLTELGAGAPQQLRTCAQNLLDIRDDDGKPLSQGTLLDLNMTLLFAGHDTSAATLMRLLFVLGTQPEVMEKLRAEQQKVQAEHGEGITEATLREMPYTEACVKEALRISPIVGTIYRRTLCEFELGGYRIPKGRRVLLNMYQVLTSDERFADNGSGDGPGKFCPERWLGDDAHRAGAWIPFGGGPRMCLGYILAIAEIKILLAVLARTSTWRLLNPSEPYVPFPLPAPRDGLLMDIEALPR